MKYMYEIRCISKSVQDTESVQDTDIMLFGGGFCSAHRLIEQDQISEEINKVCKYCAGNRWRVRRTNVLEIDFFKHSLKYAKHLFSYHVTEPGTIYKVDILGE